MGLSRKRAQPTPDSRFGNIHAKLLNKSPADSISRLGGVATYSNRGAASAAWSGPEVALPARCGSPPPPAQRLVPLEEVTSWRRPLSRWASTTRLSPTSAAWRRRGEHPLVPVRSGCVSPTDVGACVCSVCVVTWGLVNVVTHTHRRVALHLRPIHRRGGAGGLLIPTSCGPAGRRTDASFGSCVPCRHYHHYGPQRGRARRWPRRCPHQLRALRRAMAATRGCPWV